MALVEDRRGAFGRFNPVDVFMFALVVVLIPIAYGAYALFRTPPAKLGGIEPKQFNVGPNLRVRINGTNLRPFMRVTFGTTPASAYFLGSTKYALVDVPSLKPGKYDVVLFDYAREVARLPEALTIAPTATDAELELEGAFKAPSAAAASEIKAGAAFNDSGRLIARVVEVAGSVRSDIRFRVGDDSVVVPLAGRDIAATVQVKCATARSSDGVARCIIPIGDDRIVVAPDALVTFQTVQGPVLFQIARARAPRSNSHD